MTTKPRLVAVAGLLAVLAAGGIVWLRTTREDRSRVRLAYPPIVASLPVFVAEEHKMFREAGISADAVPFVNSNDMVNALVAGQFDMLPAVSLIPVLHLEIQYPGTVRLFSHSRMTPERAFDSIVVKKDSPITGVEQLAGKKVGLFPGTSATNMLKYFLKKRGIDIAKVTFVPLAPPAQLSSLQSGAVDALFSYEPVTTVAEKDGGYRRLFGSVYAELLNPCPVGCSVVARRFERGHPMLAARSVEIVDRAVELMRNDPEKAKSLLPKFAQLEEPIAVRVNVVDVTRSDEVDVGTLQKFIDLLYDAGEIPKRLEATTLTEPTR